MSERINKAAAIRAALATNESLAETAARLGTKIEYIYAVRYRERRSVAHGEAPTRAYGLTPAIHTDSILALLRSRHAECAATLQSLHAVQREYESLIAAIAAIEALESK